MREFGSEHPAILLPDGYIDTFNQYGKCTWLRSGREALHLVALNLNPIKQKPVVLMPAYCCHSMVDPFEKAGCKVVYYRLNRDPSARNRKAQGYLDNELLWSSIHERDDCLCKK